MVVFHGFLYVYQRVYHPAMDPRWKAPGSPAPSPCWEGAASRIGLCPVKQVSELKHQPTHIHYIYIYVHYIYIYVHCIYTHIYIYNSMFHTHTHTHQAFKVHMWFTLTPGFHRPSTSPMLCWRSPTRTQPRGQDRISAISALRPKNPRNSCVWNKQKHIYPIIAHH